MENRIDRKDDESLYQPKIHSERIRTLYNLKLATGKPMTVLLDQAIGELVKRYEAEYRLEDEPAIEEVKEDTWEEICEYRDTLDRLDYLKCLLKLEEMKSNQL